MRAVPGLERLRGAVDGHVHAAPHINPRRLDVLDAVREAGAAGMAGLGIMDNFANSSGLAALAMRELGSLGVDVFGGLIMEPPAGGVSAHAARIALAYRYGASADVTGGARYLSFPTHATRHVAKGEGRSPLHVEACFHVPEGPLLDPVPEILDLTAAADVVLNLGHLADAELCRLAEAARSRGVSRVLAPANHAMPGTVRELCALGAHVELSFFFVSHATGVGLTHVDAEAHTIAGVPVTDLVERIRAATPGRLVLSSDCGSSLLPPPVEGLRCFLALLEAAGIDDNTLRSAVGETPARLFRVRRPETSA